MPLLAWTRPVLPLSAAVSVGALSLAFAGVTAATVPAAPGDPVVTVTGGQIQGRRLPGEAGTVFRGIPFARPPVGELRWREPQPVVPWTGMRDAGASGAPCAQVALGWNDAIAAAGREDCLYLDVWAPPAEAGRRHAVMVWIHGGANVAGSGGADPLYDGRAFVRHGVVLVVIQYRVGILGFFAHPDLTRESPHHASGNYAILDQIAALNWVRDNITAFGGDPGNVTVFGQSAGAFDLLTLMTSPLARGLFHRAISESPAPLPARATFRSLAEAEQTGVRLAESLGVAGEGALRRLRALPVDDLLRAQRQAGWNFAAINADGWAVPAAPAEVFAAGREAPVPLLIGSNAIEFPADASPAKMRQAVEATFGGLAPRALALYGLDGEGSPGPADPVYGDRAEQVGSDPLRCFAVVEGEWHGRAGNPTWEYQFDRAIPPRPKTGHSSELPYVFGNLYAQGSQAGDFAAADHRLSAAIQGYWTNFAKTGDPNGLGLPEWPRYDATARRYLEFTRTADVVVAPNQRGAVCDLFRELLNAPAGAGSER